MFVQEGGLYGWSVGWTAPMHPALITLCVHSLSVWRDVLRTASVAGLIFREPKALKVQGGGAPAGGWPGPAPAPPRPAVAPAPASPSRPTSLAAPRLRFQSPGFWP